LAWYKGRSRSLWRHVSNVPVTPGTLETCHHQAVT
jgi:hypothetical protein